jgi:hypothetical protein
MEPTAFERLLRKLPPETQAADALSLRNLGNDPNGPIYTLYAAVFSKMDRDHKEQLANHAAREKLLLKQLANAAAASQQTICTEVGRLDQDRLWRRILVSRLADIVITLVLILIMVPMVMKHLAGRELAELQAMRAEQTFGITKILEKPEAFVAYSKFSSQAISKANSTARMMGAIASLLNLPDTRIEFKDNQLLIAGPGLQAEKNSRGETLLRITRVIPELGDDDESIEGALKKAQSGKLYHTPP